MRAKCFALLILLDLIILIMFCEEFKGNVNNELFGSVLTNNYMKIKAEGQVPKRRLYEIYLRQWAMSNIMFEIT
jgi:hypothetical protein